MTYNGVEVGIPTQGMFQEFIEREGFRFTAKEVYDYCASKEWKTKKGTPMKTLEAMANVYNSLFLQNERKGQSVERIERKPAQIVGNSTEVLKAIFSDFVMNQCTTEERLDNMEAIIAIRNLINKHIA